MIETTEKETEGVNLAVAIEIVVLAPGIGRIEAKAGVEALKNRRPRPREILMRHRRMCLTFRTQIGLPLLLPLLLRLDLTPATSCWTMHRQI